MTVYEKMADLVMKRRLPEQWARTERTIEQRLQAMLMARNDDGEPCCNEEDSRVILSWLKALQQARGA